MPFRFKINNRISYKTLANIRDTVIMSTSTNGTEQNKMRISIPVKDIVLVAIANKGVEQVRKEAQSIADECFAKKASVLAWVRKVEKGELIVEKAGW